MRKHIIIIALISIILVLSFTVIAKKNELSLQEQFLQGLEQLTQFQGKEVIVEYNEEHINEVLEQVAVKARQHIASFEEQGEKE